MAVDQAMIDQACALLGVTEVGRLKDGGQKTVRLVEDSAGTSCVLKVISLGGTSPQALQRAAREVDLLQSLNSPHVVRAVSDLELLGPEDGDATGAAWIEEYLDGEDLSDRLGSPWPWADARVMGVQVARGLGAMHAARVIHRDLSADNIRCTSDGSFKVMDPGVARHQLLPPITMLGHPGTPGFCSPEHLRPPPAGPSAFSDVFCLGILLWTAVLGESPIPYHGDLNDYALRLANVELTGRAAAELALTPEQFAFMGSCLHRQPARRFRDGMAAATELEKL